MKTNKKRKNRMLSALLSGALTLGGTASAFTVLAQEMSDVESTEDDCFKSTTEQSSLDSSSTSELENPTDQTDPSGNPDQSEDGMTEADGQEEKLDTSTLSGLLQSLEPEDSLTVEVKLPENCRIDPVGKTDFLSYGLLKVDSVGSYNSINQTQVLYASLRYGQKIDKKTANEIERYPHQLPLIVHCLYSANPEDPDWDHSKPLSLECLAADPAVSEDGKLLMKAPYDKVPEYPSINEEIELPVTLSEQAGEENGKPRHFLNKPFDLYMDIDTSKLTEVLQNSLPSLVKEDGSLWVDKQSLHFAGRLTVPWNFDVKGAAFISPELENLGFTIENEESNTGTNNHDIRFEITYRERNTSLSELQSLIEKLKSNIKVRFQVELAGMSSSDTITDRFEGVCDGSFLAWSGDNSSLLNLGFPAKNYAEIQLDLPQRVEKVRYEEFTTTIAVGNKKVNGHYQVESGKKFDVRLYVSQNELHDLLNNVQKTLRKSEGKSVTDKLSSSFEMDLDFPKITYEVSVPNEFVKENDIFTAKLESGSPLFKLRSEKLTMSPVESKEDYQAIEFTLEVDPQKVNGKSFESLCQEVMKDQDGLCIQIPGFQLNEENKKGNSLSVWVSSKDSLMRLRHGLTDDNGADIPERDFYNVFNLDSRNVVSVDRVDTGQPPRPNTGSTTNVSKLETVGSAILIDKDLQDKDVDPGDTEEISCRINFGDLKKEIEEQTKSLNKMDNIEDSGTILHLKLKLPNGISWVDKPENIKVSDLPFKVTASEYKNNVLTVDLEAKPLGETVEEYQKKAAALFNEKGKITFGKVKVSSSAKRNRDYRLNLSGSGSLFFTRQISENSKTTQTMRFNLESSEAILRTKENPSSDKKADTSKEDSSKNSSGDSSKKNSSSSRDSGYSSKSGTSSTSRTRSTQTYGSSTRRSTSSSKTTSSKASSSTPTKARTSVSTDRQLFAGIAGIAVFGAAAVWMLMKKKND